MQAETIISVQGVSKKFCRSLRRTMLYGARDVACDMFGLSQRSIGLRQDEFWALDDVSFEVKRGECLGVIGPNGAGKSTLLKLLNGITLPDRGEIKVAGRIGALLELGAGFHPLLTGRENIYLTGAILGLSEANVAKKFDAIVDFSGLEEFIDSPVKHYSSGMYVRLGFAMAAYADPDVFLIDEALAVGDAYFVQKCFSAFEQFQNRGVTILFVSHDMNIMRRYCQEVIWLDGGSIVRRGEPKAIIDLYNAMIFERIASHGRKIKVLSAKEFATGTSAGDALRFGNAAAEIVETSLLDSKLRAVDVVTSGEEATFRIVVRFKALVKDVVFGITIRDKRGLEVYGTNTLWKTSRLDPCRPGGVIRVEFKQKMMLARGDYFVNVAVNQKRPEGLVRLDWMADVIQFSVIAVDEFMGFCNLNSEISVQFI
jgi:lipopolysaccharide transport system ATP-binding protein